jgi:hypothetical protein
MIDKELVLKELLSSNFEAYLAIPSQAGANYDITVVLDEKCVVRLKVRMQTLENESTNNSVVIDSNYDFLVLVVIDNGKNRFFILSNLDIAKEKGSNVKLSISNCKNGVSEVLSNISEYENKWESIKNEKHHEQ